MPRIETSAAERSAQRQKLAAEVSRELGYPVSVKQATEHRRVQTALGVPTPDQQEAVDRDTKRKQDMKYILQLERHLIADRSIDIPDNQLRHLGRLLARCGDYTVRKGSISWDVSSPMDFIHLMADIALLSANQSLIFDVWQYTGKVPGADGEPSDTTEGAIQ